MQKLIFTVLSLFGFLTTVAKSDTTMNPVLGYYFTMPIEFPLVDNNKMNEQLKTMGYPECKPPVAVAGFGFQVQLLRSIMSLSYNQSTRRPGGDSTNPRTRYWGTSFNIGYDLVKHTLFSVYPYAGIKYNGLTWQWDGTSTADSNLLNNFGTPLDQNKITNRRVHVDLGVGLSHQWFYLISIRAGCLLPLQRSDWTMNKGKTTLLNAPGVRYQAYISLTLGLGNIFDKKMLDAKYKEQHQ